MELSICDDFGIPHSEFLAWDSDDQDKAVAFRLMKAESCPRCGTRPEEWMISRFAYEAQFHRCRGCEILEMAQENLSEQKGTHGMFVRLVPSEPPDNLPAHIAKRFKKGT